MDAANETLAPVRTHRFAAIVSGGIALGSYEAGVLTQLYHDLYWFNQNMAGRAHVAIDVIAGASAGSVTGLILAQALALGDAPDRLEKHLRTCWVDLLSIQNLLTVAKDPQGSRGAVFSGDVIEQIIAQALDRTPAAPETPQEAVALWITMTNLDGIPFVIDFKRMDEEHAQVTTELYALDYKDYVPFLIEGNRIAQIQPEASIPDTELRMIFEGRTHADDAAFGWEMAAEAARASGAFPMAFPSRYQQRNLDAYKDYRGFKAAVAAGLAQKAGDKSLEQQDTLPAQATMQFVDGGLFNNEPIGRAIEAVAYVNRKYPKRNPENNQFNGERAGRSFLMIEPEPQLPSEVARALSQKPPTASPLPPALLIKIISAYFNHALYDDFKTAQETNEKLTALKNLFATLPDTPEQEKLQQQVLEAAGLADKEIVTLQRIPQSSDVQRRLASAFAGHFGGFLRRDYRMADFVTGRHEARAWLTEWLGKWLCDHAGDAGLTGKSEEAVRAFVETQLPNPPADPRTVRITPDGEIGAEGLTPGELADAGWYPVRNPTDVQQQAALTKEQRRDILKDAEPRLDQLIDVWGHHNLALNLLAKLINPVLEHVLIPDPNDPDS
jgi:predicted acylesterase/phospholipase RssA